MQHQMTTAEILLNPSVETADEKRLSRQCREILSLFRYKNFRLYLPVTTTDLMEIAGQYQARLGEVRRWLIKYENCCIDLIEKGKGGVNYYRIVPLDESEFYKQRKAKL